MAGTSWALLEGNLPVHLEARPLVRDPTSPETLYAGYSLMPYGELWRTALEGGNLLSRVDLVSLAGGLAFLLLLAVRGCSAHAGCSGAHGANRRHKIAPLPSRERGGGEGRR